MNKIKLTLVLSAILLAAVLGALGYYFFIREDTVSHVGKATDDASESETCTVYSSYVEGQPRENPRVLRGWQKKAGLLDSKLTKALPVSDYGGLWIDRASDRIHVGLVKNTDTSSTSRKTMQSVFKRLGLSEGVDIVLVTYSETTLKQTLRAIHKLHQELVVDKEWPIQMGLKTNCNKVQVDIPTEEHLTPGHYKVLSVIEVKYKDQVFFVTYDSPPQNEGQLE